MSYSSKEPSTVSLYDFSTPNTISLLSTNYKEIYDLSVQWSYIIFDIIAFPWENLLVFSDQLSPLFLYPTYLGKVKLEPYLYTMFESFSICLSLLRPSFCDHIKFYPVGLLVCSRIKVFVYIKLSSHLFQKSYYATKIENIHNLPVFSD